MAEPVMKAGHSSSISTSSAPSFIKTTSKPVKAVKAVKGGGSQPAPALAQHEKNVVVNQLCEEVNDCTRCPLRGERLFPVCGRGGSGVRLLIIGDWCYSAQQRPGEKVFPVFGSEEDSMLARMMQAIKLPREQFFVTNLVKCALLPSSKVAQEAIVTCSSYVYRQIEIFRPQIICAMGTAAAQTILQTSQPLSRLRGKSHCYRCSEAGEIEVVPTYHPRFLLQNPEMKKATWSDLQEIEKKLQA